VEGTADGCSCRVLGVLGMEVGGGLVYGPVISPKSFGGTLFLPDDLFRCFLHADSSTYPFPSPCPFHIHVQQQEEGQDTSQLI
jgi:hypothetical protein